jgi:hypothetical protein
MAVTIDFRSLSVVRVTGILFDYMNDHQLLNEGSPSHRLLLCRSRKATVRLTSARVTPHGIEAPFYGTSSAYLLMSVVFSGSYFPSLSVESEIPSAESLVHAHPVPKGPDKCETKHNPEMSQHSPPSVLQTSCCSQNFIANDRISS